MTRFFANQAIVENKQPIIIFHNGSAQRGHTVDYTENFRHVYHHFGSGTADNVPTFFGPTFWIHPMEFKREWLELKTSGIVVPKAYCDPRARVVTPFDMLVDHITEDWIALQTGMREHGSCGYGTWCAIEDRGTQSVYSIKDYISTYDTYLRYILENTWHDCLSVLIGRGVDIDQLPQYKKYFTINSEARKNIINNFINDIKFFLSRVNICSFDELFSKDFTFIFENGQGLGLDMNVNNKWHTTSNTGLTNSVDYLKDKDVNVEVCYITRSYLTRHGIGPMEEEVRKSAINAEMVDLTNVPNPFQGSLRYGYLNDREQQQRIEKDWSLVKDDKRFKKTMAVTHCNEFPDESQTAKYYSDSPFYVKERK